MVNVAFKAFKDHQEIMWAFYDDNHEQITEFVDLIVSTLKRAGSVYWIGNGGSAADCQHLSAELVWRFRRNRDGFRSMALTTDMSAVTAIGNDWHFDNIFERQIRAIADPADKWELVWKAK